MAALWYFHCHPKGADLFVTWRLFGSLPRDSSLSTPPASFAAMDRDLGSAAIGPRWLADERVSRCVADSFRFGGDIASNHKGNQELLGSAG